MRFASLPLLLLTACVISMTPRVNTQEAVIQYVNRATEVVADQGSDACLRLSSGQWSRDDWYIFVLDAEGRTLCHPRPEQVGVSVHELVDARGKRFGDEFLRVAGEGGGWVSYLWARPGETDTVDKTSYLRQVTGPDGKVYIVGSGGYELR